MIKGVIRINKKEDLNDPLNAGEMWKRCRSELENGYQFDG